MDLTIADLKVGAKLVFGNYGVDSAVHPITWLKASKECDFISEFVLDQLRFDAVERLNPNRDFYWHGNTDYESSNIIQFLNSFKDDWFVPMHTYDSAPGNPANIVDAIGDYVNHAGFLHHFEDYELDCLSSRVDLPTSANIYGNGVNPRFQLFSRKGFRGKPHEDLVWNKRGHNMTESSFCDFWLSDRADAVFGNHYLCYVSKSGRKDIMYPSGVIGLRPKCKINQNAKVEQLPDGSGYRILPFETQNVRTRCGKVCTDDEFMELMGLL